MVVNSQQISKKYNQNKQILLSRGLTLKTSKKCSQNSKKIRKCNNSQQLRHSNQFKRKVILIVQYNNSKISRSNSNNNSNSYQRRKCKKIKFVILMVAAKMISKNQRMSLKNDHLNIGLRKLRIQIIQNRFQMCGSLSIEHHRLKIEKLKEKQI